MKLLQRVLHGVRVGLWTSTPGPLNFTGGSVKKPETMETMIRNISAQRERQESTVGSAQRERQESTVGDVAPYGW